MPKANLSIARKSKIVTKSMFSNYDLCINPYVGCQFGCKYCYVRFTVKDKDHEWGEFVRIREHLKEKLPKELDQGSFKIEDGSLPVIGANGERERTAGGKPKKQRLYKTLTVPESRLVIGTMTDPYQQSEGKFKITRSALEILTNHANQFKKVGIFTRSPLVLRDIDLIKKLPNARVHYTVTPYQPEVLRAIEPLSPKMEKRWKTVKALKDAGLRVHVNVSPIIPILSEGFEQDFIDKLTSWQVDEYFVDPMQPYKEAWDAFKETAEDLEGVDFSEIEEIMMNRQNYLKWKDAYFKKWDAIRKPLQHRAPDQLPIWSDHENKVWVDMKTGQQMSKRVYGDG